MSKLSREEFISRTFQLATESTSEGIKAKYWEIAGRALGYLEPPKVENQNIAIFQSISNDMIAFLKQKGEDIKSIEANYVEVNGNAAS